MHFDKHLVKAFGRTICLVLASTFLAGTAFAQASYRIATEGTYPPWSFKDAQGTLQGWDVDIAHALCEKMKAKCEVVAQDWDGIIPGLMARKYCWRRPKTEPLLRVVPTQN